MVASSATPACPTLPETVWRASQLAACRAATVASGYAALDHELPGGGWPAAALTELLLPQAGIGEMRLLMPPLGSLMQDGKYTILVAPPHIPFAQAFEQSGMDLRRILLVYADKPADRVWVAEQVLKSGSAGALLCWLPQVSMEQLRRLQVAASGGEGLAFMFRPMDAQVQSSPAPLRLACSPAAGGRLSLRILKRRGPSHDQPLLVQLPLPPVLAGPLADRMAVPSFSDALSDVVDRHSFPSAAARRRATFLV